VSKKLKIRKTEVGDEFVCRMGLERVCWERGWGE
jgi:hypothetical protein